MCVRMRVLCVCMCVVVLRCECVCKGGVLNVCATSCARFMCVCRYVHVFYVRMCVCVSFIYACVFALK